MLSNLILNITFHQEKLYNNIVAKKIIHLLRKDKSI